MGVADYGIEIVRTLAYDIAIKNKGMYILNNKENCLKNVPVNYYLKSIEVLEKHCKDVVESINSYSKIFIIDDSHIGPSVVGGYYEYGINYYIKINSNQNTCWRRFGLIKELCSLLVNHHGRVKSSWQLKTFQDYQESMDTSINQKKDFASHNIDQGDLESDTFAILLAAEIMIPPQHRKQMMNLLDRFKNGQMKMNDIAQSLSMPEAILQKMVDYHLYNSNDFYNSLGY